MTQKFTPHIQIVENMIAMPDGIRLFTRVFLPRGESGERGRRYPVVFHRSPYEPGISAASYSSENLKGPLRDFIAAGYAVVNQHCRGTGMSDGVFRNMRDERGDGLATLEWIRKREWYGGEIYLYGASYKSYVHSACIPDRPPDVRGAVLAVMPSNIFHVCYERTTFKHDLYTLWFTRLYMKNQLDAEAKFAAARDCLKKRPLSSLPERLYGHPVPELTAPFAHNREDDEFWRTGEGFGDSYNAPAAIDFPLLLIGGYYDIHFRGTLDYWERLNPAAKARSAMLIGPWGHSHNTPPEHDEIFPGSRRSHPELEFFEHIRTGTPLLSLREGEITYYTAGGGWRQAKSLGEGADSRLVLFPACGGRLTDLPPPPGAQSYDYDPEHPACFIGGANVFQSGNAGLQPQSGPAFRPDVLSFVSSPLTEDITLDGEIGVRLEVSSDCPDTAFFVRACIVREGTAYNLRDTIVALRDELGDYTPGERVTLGFTLDPIAWTARAGERLRFDVSSSNFPTYNAHSNTADYWADASLTRIARNTLFMPGSRFTFRVRE